jgi:hypothetical protein
MLRDGEWYAAQEKADALRAALAKQTEPVAWQDTSNPKELVAAEDWENIDPAWHWMYRPLYAEAEAIRARGEKLSSQDNFSKSPTDRRYTCHVCNRQEMVRAKFDEESG